MSDEPHEIKPYLAIAPDRNQDIVKDFRPRFEEATTGTEEEELFGGLTVEQVKPEGEGSGEDVPKGDTATESANSSKTTESSPTAPPVPVKGKPASVDSGGSQSKPGKVSPPTS